MEIRIDQIGKRFNKEWIFRKLSAEIPMNTSLAITGHNGSGKSTLIKILTGFTDPTEGNVVHLDQGKELSTEQIVLQIGFAAPYVNLIEELTLKEHLDFHFTFRTSEASIDEIIERSRLEGATNKRIGDFSSGMKQRLKLCLAMYAKNEVLVLDEPTANMDEQGISWYQREIKSLINSRTIIIASNQRYEYDFIENRIDISSFKHVRNRTFR